MSSRNLDVTDAAGVRTISLDRPSALNAFSTALFDELRDVLDEAWANDSVKCVVFTGRGRAFSAGLDLNDFEPDDLADPDRGFPGCVRALERFGKPLVAAVNGLAVGFGATVLLHCDIVVAASKARFRLPFVPLALAPEAASSYLLPLRVGAQEAAHLLFTGSWIDAHYARSIGLVWRVCEPADLLAHASAVAHEIAAGPVESLVATKSLLLAARAEQVERAREDELAAYAKLLHGPAHQRAVAEFRSARG
jgi:enoyl-CoA hydratase/carnithine racemase